MKTIQPEEVCKWIAELVHLRAEFRDVRKAYVKRIKDMVTRIEYYSDANNRAQGELDLDDSKDD